MAPAIMDWVLKNSGKIVGAIGNFFKTLFENRKTKKEEKEKNERKISRGQLIKQIEEAEEKEDHEELKRLHIALHVLDSTRD